MPYFPSVVNVVGIATWPRHVYCTCYSWLIVSYFLEDFRTYYDWTFTRRLQITIREVDMGVYLAKSMT